MILKKYINNKTIEDVPQNGIITIEIENDNGESVEAQTGVSNLLLAFAKDENLANKNGYYQLVEEEIPEYDEETQYIDYEYILENNTIYKKYSVKDIETIDDIADGVTE